MLELEIKDGVKVVARDTVLNVQWEGMIHEAAEILVRSTFIPISEFGARHEEAAITIRMWMPKIKGTYKDVFGRWMVPPNAEKPTGKKPGPKVSRNKQKLLEAEEKGKEARRRRLIARGLDPDTRQKIESKPEVEACQN